MIARASLLIRVAHCLCSNWAILFDSSRSCGSDRSVFYHVWTSHWRTIQCKRTIVARFNSFSLSFRLMPILTTSKLPSMSLSVTETLYIPIYPIGSTLSPMNNSVHHLCHRMSSKSTSVNRIWNRPWPIVCAEWLWSMSSEMEKADLIRHNESFIAVKIVCLTSTISNSVDLWAKVLSALSI